MDEVVASFQSESMGIIAQLVGILESIEGDYSKFRRLEEYGQLVDRIMGAAACLIPVIPELTDVLSSIDKYGQLCKMVSYKCSQIENNEGLYHIVVAFLLDTTEMLQFTILNLNDSKSLDTKSELSKTFIERLKWISDQLPADLRASLAAAIKDKKDPSVL